MNKDKILIVLLIVLAGAFLVSAGKYEFLDSAGAMLFNISSDGNAYLPGNLTAERYFGDNSIGLFRGVTPLQYTGNITNGSLIGYEAANNICDVHYSGSHFCLEVEIMKTNNIDSTITGQMWTAKGAAGYTAAANDCEGWTKVANEIGPFWDYTENSGVGAGKLTPCTSELNISCCGGQA